MRMFTTQHDRPFRLILYWNQSQPSGSSCIGRECRLTVAREFLLHFWHGLTPFSMLTARSSPANIFLARLFSLRRVLIGFALIGSFLFQFSVAWMRKLPMR